MRLRRAAVLSLVASCPSLACVPPHAAQNGPPIGADVTVTTEPVVLPLKPTPPQALLVLSKRDEALSIVDPATLEVVARVPVGHDPHEVIASPDGTLAYVSNYGRGTFSTLAVVDLVVQKPRPAVDLGGLRGPHGLAYAGGRVWFTAEGAKAVGSYDPARGAIDWILGTGQDRTHMLVVSRDLNRVITSNVASGTLSFLEKGSPQPGQGGPPEGGGGGRPPGGDPRQAPPPGGGWEQTLVTVGAGTEGFDVTPNGLELWAADAQDGSIAVVDVATRRVAQRIAANARGANRLKITPDGRWALVSSLGGPEVIVFDVASRAESKRIPVGHGSSGILVQPDGARAFVSCTPDGYVAVIDLRTMTMVGRIAGGTDPDGLAWAVRP